MYGISIDNDMKGNEFEYLIADNYNPAKDIPADFVTHFIPEYMWAIFPCKGALRNTGSLHDIHEKIFTEWLPQNKDYEIAAGYRIDYSEIWIPVHKK